MVTQLRPDNTIGLALLRQEWRTITFVHWRYRASALQPMLPSGLTVEEYDGSAWVSMTPFLMRNVRPAGTPPLPRLSTFPETNLRTYVRGPDGGQGIWFFSLDAASNWITIGARLLLGVPYFRGRLGIVEIGDGIGYTGTRTWRGPAGYHLRVRPGQPIEPSGLDVWLTHRWRAYTRHAGCLVEIPVRHEPWPLRAAAVTMLDESLTTAAGLAAPPEATLAHYSDGVTDVAFGAPRPVSFGRRTPGKGNWLDRPPWR
jgi:uncharacterized protein YqjF (DUF2071 family)